MVTRKYKTRFELVWNMVRGWSSVVWSGEEEVWDGLGEVCGGLRCFNGPGTDLLRYEWTKNKEVLT